MINDRMIPPASLYDIVRANNNEFEISIASELELKARLISMPRDISVTERLFEACFVAFRYRFPEVKDGSRDTIHLVGTKCSDGNPRITNLITGIYRDSIYTLSGSHYKIESTLAGEIPPEYLAVICKSIQGTRLAEYIKAPPWESLLPLTGSVLH